MCQMFNYFTPSVSMTIKREVVQIYPVLTWHKGMIFLYLFWLIINHQTSEAFAWVLYEYECLSWIKISTLNIVCTSHKYNVHVLFLDTLLGNQTWTRENLTKPLYHSVYLISHLICVQIYFCTKWLPMPTSRLSALMICISLFDWQTWSNNSMLFILTE